jgi:hypothetical protein
VAHDTILEWRHYVATPGCAERLLERFRGHTLPLFREHGMKVVLFGRDPENGGDLHYVLAWPDRTAMERCWATFAADDRWQRVRAWSEADGPLIASIQRRILEAVQTGSAEVTG